MREGLAAAWRWMAEAPRKRGGVRVLQAILGGFLLFRVLTELPYAPLLLCSGVPLEPLPAWCDGQLAKDTYDLEELRVSAQRARRLEGT